MPHKDPDARKACLKEYHRKWYQANKESRKGQIREYKKDNADKVAQYESWYRSRPEYRDRRAARKRAVRAADRDRDRQIRRLWYRKNRDHVLGYPRNQRSRREYFRQYYLLNQDYYRYMSKIGYMRRLNRITNDQFELIRSFADKRK